MNLIMIDGVFWVLNTDDKIQLVDGVPHAKYDSGPTPEQSEITIYVA